MTTRDIQEIVKELYGVDVSPDLISRVTEDLDTELKAWQSRMLPSVFPIVFFDGIVVHVRGADAKVSPHTIYVALGIDLEGKKELLGLWIAKTEGAKFWLGCLTDLRNRGLEDIFICCVDGLAGFPEAIRTAYPQARVQLCLVHLVRAALRYVATKPAFIDAQGNWMVLAGDRGLRCWGTESGRPLTPITPLSGINFGPSVVRKQNRVIVGTSWSDYIDSVSIEDLFLDQQSELPIWKEFAELASHAEVRGSIPVVLDLKQWSERMHTLQREAPEMLADDWTHQDLVHWHESRRMLALKERNWLLREEGQPGKSDGVF